MSILGISISKKLACSLIVLPEVPKSGRGGGLKAYPWMGDADGAGDARTGKQWGDGHEELRLVHQNHGAQPGLPTPLNPGAHTSLAFHPHYRGPYPSGAGNTAVYLPGQRLCQTLTTKALSLFSQITRSLQGTSTSHPRLRESSHCGHS